MSRRALYHLKVIAALVVTLTLAMGLFAAMAPAVGMTTVYIPILLFLATWVACSFILCMGYAQNLPAWLAIPLMSFFAVSVIFSCEAEFLIDYKYAHPAPRPMFYNLFAGHERSLLPYWHEDMPMSDENHNLIWADDDDNVLALVVKGSFDGSYVSPRSGLKESSIHVHGFGVSRDVVVPRTTNALVVIRTDGKVQQFKLKPAVVRDFHQQRAHKRIKDLIADASVLLDAADRTALLTFLAGTNRKPDGG